MKKSFFKKLSFVLALAMIVSVIAPAAGAFAAADPTVNTSKKYLFLGESGKNEYDFNVKNKIKGSTYEWSSDNESVAVVDASNGYTTAKSVGTATISLLVTDKKGNTYPSEATVIVKDNIKSLAITNKPANDTLAVGAENDFNRSFTTQSGSTKKTTSVTRWVVTDADGKATDKATIDNSGVFKATEAGTYTITANAFQSAAKFESWKTSGDSTLIQATDSYKVTVKNSMTVAQKDLNTFNLTFGSAVTDTTKLSVYYVAGTTEVFLPTKAVTLSSDGKTISVDMYSNLSASTTYVVKYSDLDSVSFVAASSNVADVKSVSITTTSATVNTATTVGVALYNADGVDILNGISGNDITTLYSRVTLASSNTTTSSFSSPTLYMYSIGATTTITATFHTYNYDTSGNELGVVTGTGAVTCVDVSYDSLKGITAYTFDADVPAAFDDDFSSVNHTIAVDDALYLYVNLSVYDASAYTTVAQYSDAATLGTFAFESSNPNVLFVDPSTGRLYPLTEGTANVVVYFTPTDSGTKSVAGAVPVTVSSKRKVATSVLSSYNATLSKGILNSYTVASNVASGAAITDVASSTLTIKDQYGTLLDPSKYSILTSDFSTVPTGASSTSLDASITGLGVSSGASATITFEASNTTVAGTYVYKVIILDYTTWTYSYAYVTITVVDPGTNLTVSYFKLEAGATTYDEYISAGDTTRNATLSLIGYNSSGYKIVKYAGQPINYVIPSTTGTSSVTTNADGVATIPLVTLAVSGSSAVAKANTGTWTASITINSRTYYTYFTVKDSTPDLTYTLNTYYSDEASITAALQNDCIDVYYNGSEVTIDTVTDVTNVSGTNTYFVRSITYTETIDTYNYVTHTLYLNKTFYINQ